MSTSTTDRPAVSAPPSADVSRKRRKPSRPIGPPPGRPTRITRLHVDELIVSTPGGKGSAFLGFTEAGALTFQLYDAESNAFACIGQTVDGGWVLGLAEQRDDHDGPTIWRACLGLTKEGKAYLSACDATGKAVEGLVAHRGVTSAPAAGPTPTPADWVNGLAKQLEQEGGRRAE